MPEQLCWSCAKACGGCSWSRRYEKKPVPGWTAKKKVYKANGGGKDGITYAITKCPEYVQDCEDSSKPRRFQTMAALLYNAGKNDVEIARALDSKDYVVHDWRVRTGRKANYQSGRPKGEAGA